ncbi:TatD family hydrolase [Feifania hominis]|uniref:TatD family hydrolase n=1 Tax=Feifania hominis TaxID=2763660 RepID=A0A926HQI3_9FIRM|nr:TatD family hydrolase [Feifania hominis]MBC8536372.1 TatD family hydrolase [Feifania hominis]
MLFDSHAHYCDERFADDRDELLSSLPAHGISHVLTCPSTPEETAFSLELAHRYAHVWAAAGIHCHECGAYGFDALEQIERYAADERCVAIGEIGLDYALEFHPRALQRDWFERQILLANRLGLPVIVHDREAHADTMELLHRHRPRGVVHCYSGSAEMAKELLALGFYISFTGVITFKNARRAVEAAEVIPLDRLLIETDSPYLAPVPHRGERNDSTLVRLTCERLAEIKGVSFDEMARLTCRNACELFAID